MEEKLLALLERLAQAERALLTREAHRLGLTEVIIPARNAADLDDVPESVRAELTVPTSPEAVGVRGP